MTYLALNAAFLVAPVLLLVLALRKLSRSRRPAPLLTAGGIALAVVLVLTAVFDNVMIALDLFTYPPEHLSGVRIGLAPLEDFAYPLCAAFGVPAVFALLRPRGRAA